MSELNGSVLAYMGDAVLSLQVRKHLVEMGLTRPKTLLNESIKYVSATAQANFMSHLLSLEILSDVEKSVYRRGRNYKSQSVAKNADIVSYRIATGLEALWGYWYLEDQMDRLREVFHIFVGFVEKS